MTDCRRHGTHTTTRVIFIGSVILDFLVAYFAMLALGVLHLDWSPVVPALGYFPTFVLVFAFTSLIGACLFSIVARQMRLIEIMEDRPL